MLIAGVYPSRIQIIPPGVKDFVLAGHCSADCTATAIPPEGINVLAFGVHAHLNGWPV